MYPSRIGPSFCGVLFSFFLSKESSCTFLCQQIFLSWKEQMFLLEIGICLTPLWCALPPRPGPCNTELALEGSMRLLVKDCQTLVFQRP